MPLWKFKDCIFSYPATTPPLETEQIECSRLLATCIKAILDKTGRGEIEYLGIGVDRKFPRRADGTQIKRKINGHWVLTGHWKGNPDGPEAIDWIATSNEPTEDVWPQEVIYRAAVEVSKEHPNWHMSVVNEPTWVHIEVNYPHLEP